MNLRCFSAHSAHNSVLCLRRLSLANCCTACGLSQDSTACAPPSTYPSLAKSTTHQRSKRPPTRAAACTTSGATARFGCSQVPLLSFARTSCVRDGSGEEGLQQLLRRRTLLVLEEVHDLVARISIPVKRWWRGGQRLTALIPLRPRPWGGQAMN